MLTPIRFLEHKQRPRISTRTAVYHVVRKVRCHHQLFVVPTYWGEEEGLLRWFTAGNERFAALLLLAVLLAWIFRNRVKDGRD